MCSRPRLRPGPGCTLPDSLAERGPNSKERGSGAWVGLDHVRETEGGEEGNDLVQQ